MKSKFQTAKNHIEKKGLKAFLDYSLFFAKVRTLHYLGVLSKRLIRQNTYLLDFYRFLWKYLNKIFRYRFTDADPFKVIWVSPKDIDFVSESPFNGIYGIVKGGDWDKGVKKFEDTKCHQSLQKAFIQNDWSQYKDYFEEKVEIENAWSYQNKDFEKRKKEVEKLFERIKESYKTQKELSSKDMKLIERKNNDAVHPFLNEITVDIGREGDLLWRRNGQHRLSIAKILEIEKVPVIVMKRHKEWQRIRYFSQEEYSHHPDFPN